MRQSQPFQNSRITHRLLNSPVNHWIEALSHLLHYAIYSNNGRVCWGSPGTFFWLNMSLHLNVIIIHSKFSQFWLAKSTRIIYHNPLLLTKFGRILFLTRKWRQKCSPLQVNAPLTEKTWGRGWVVLVVKTKMADTLLVSRVRITAGNRRNNSKKHSKSSKTTRTTNVLGIILNKK